MVTITKNNNRLSVSSPYHPDFAPKAKRLGGEWDGANRRWTFDVRDAERVSALCRSIYGTDGAAPEGPTMTVRLTATSGHSASQKGIYFAGRCLAHATGRDSGAKLGAGVVLLVGDIGSGGSVKNWTTYIEEGSILEVRDLPQKSLTAKMREGWKVVRVKSDADAAESRAALEREKTALCARIAEIDAQIAVLTESGEEEITDMEETE